MSRDSPSERGRKGEQHTMNQRRVTGEGWHKEVNQARLPDATDEVADRSHGEVGAATGYIVCTRKHIETCNFPSRVTARASMTTI